MAEISTSSMEASLKHGEYTVAKKTKREVVDGAEKELSFVSCDKSTKVLTEWP
uniref:Uncharacterized protein n=1 Tax=Anguilla anguilla TaxID=7936 RepID=A0A0E9VR98_ANGAN